MRERERERERERKRQRERARESDRERKSDWERQRVKERATTFSLKKNGNKVATLAVMGHSCFCTKPYFMMAIEGLYVKIKRTSLKQRKTAVSYDFFAFFQFLSFFSIFYPLNSE